MTNKKVISMDNALPRVLIVADFRPEQKADFSVHDGAGGVPYTYHWPYCILLEVQ